MRTLKLNAQLTIGFFAAVTENYGDSQRTLEHRNKQNGSKSTNHDRQTWPFGPAEVKFCFLSAIDGSEKSKPLVKV